MFRNNNHIDSNEEDGPDMRLSRDRHAKRYRCYHHKSSPYHTFQEPAQESYQADSGKRVERKKVHLAILSVCRQAYVEVNPIFWGSTTWSFMHALDFCKFMHERRA